eukprot:CAMPEP_0183413566 /NCGR_PEP_ID=MMETSP0370-20130417/21791_1 /TAXON_ID=268820 /ORGANISM="Peridinium aciculiferum, Strain PAER-2" /LENGTH=88 /DNA_ID=CAMNT_0025596783 /DNA_START=253 /DNA_END=516 /DNA_ORIENTATION=-
MSPRRMHSPSGTSTLACLAASRASSCSSSGDFSGSLRVSETSDSQLADSFSLRMRACSLFVEALTSVPPGGPPAGCRSSSSRSPSCAS